MGFNDIVTDARSGEVACKVSSRRSPPMIYGWRSRTDPRHRVVIGVIEPDFYAFLVSFEESI